MAEDTKSTFDSDSSLGRLGIHRSTTGSETHCISNSPFSTFEFSKPLSVLFFTTCCCLKFHHFVSSVNSFKKKKLKGHVSMNISGKSRKGRRQILPNVQQTQVKYQETFGQEILRVLLGVGRGCFSFVWSCWRREFFVWRKTIHNFTISFRV